MTKELIYSYSQAESGKDFRRQKLDLELNLREIEDLRWKVKVKDKSPKFKFLLETPKQRSGKNLIINALFELNPNGDSIYKPIDGINLIYRFYEQRSFGPNKQLILEEIDFVWHKGITLESRLLPPNSSALQYSSSPNQFPRAIYLREDLPYLSALFKAQKYSFRIPDADFCSKHTIIALDTLIEVLYRKKSPNESLLSAVKINQ